MFENKSENYKRKLTPQESFLFRSPFSIVTLVARIKGETTHEELEEAVKKVQRRHINLRMRIHDDENNDSWLTTEGVGDIPVTSIQRQSDEHWINVMHADSENPFDFTERPAIRFIRLYSPTVSEILIICHHTICDGLSLAYLARDLLEHMGDPDKEVEVLPIPEPISKDNLPVGLKLNFVAKMLINRINKGWLKERLNVTQQDYETLNEAYWSNFTHKVIPVELDEEETTALVKRCKEEQTSVNSALTSAFSGALQSIVTKGPKRNITAIAGNLRDSLVKKPGEAMGYFAGAITPDLPYDHSKGFWDNARALNKKVKPLYTNKEIFKDGLNWAYLEPSLLEAFNYKLLGDIAPEGSKVNEFSKRQDTVTKLLKRNEMETRYKLTMGAAVTNLTRMPFPRTYGSIELDRMLMNPGGAFPLTSIYMVVGVVTVSGKLSIVIEYAGEMIETEKVLEVKEKALEYLFG